MANVSIKAPHVDLEEPTLIDGMPGRGLIGKLVVDHLIDQFDMEYYAGVYCEGVPTVAAYRANQSGVRPPVQLLADPDNDLLALSSDIPVSPSEAPEFARCLTDWLLTNDATAIYLSGLDNPVADDEDGRNSPELYGLATGDGERLLDDAGIVQPRYPGVVTGPTGALLHHADQIGVDGVGLLVESDDEYPDIDAAQVVIEHGIEPLLGVDIDTEPFGDRSVEMSPITEAFLDQIQESVDASSQAQPTATFH